MIIIILNISTYKCLRRFKIDACFSKLWLYIWKWLYISDFEFEVLFFIFVSCGLRDELSPYLCFISFLYLDLYVLGEDAKIS